MDTVKLQFILQDEALCNDVLSSFKGWEKSVKEADIQREPIDEIKLSNNSKHLPINLEETK